MYVAGDGVVDQNVHPGDEFAAKAASDVVVNGWVVVRKDADGQGTIGAIQHAGRNAAANGLAMTFDWVRATDGTKISLSASQERSGANPDPWWVGQRLRAFGMAGVFRIVSVYVKDNVSVRTSTLAEH